MSFAGLKKQINKANQFMSEKIGGAKGTELDEEFIEMERKTDVMGKLVEDLINKTHEFLQPNPASRTKLAAMNSFQKIRGQAKNNMYPQPEGTLGEHMQKHGADLGEDSMFGLARKIEFWKMYLVQYVGCLLNKIPDLTEGQSLIEAGEAFKSLGEVKYSLEEGVKQNFLEPLSHLQTKDLKEVNHHRKKLSGRRLDFDCKRRKKEKGSTITEEDLRVAEEKFEESKQLTETAMFNLLENDVEQIAQLQSFIESQTEYHRQALDILQNLSEDLDSRRSQAASRPKVEHIPKPLGSFKRSPSPFEESDGNSGSYNFNSSPAYASNARPSRQEPCAEALYDFEPENEGELGFSEGQIITLITQIDENWFEGSVNGNTGFFPINYVKVVVPLP